MKTVGLSTCGFALTDANFAALAAAHIDAVEISMTWDQYKDIDYAALRRYADTHGVRLWSYHLPFQPFETVNLSSPDKAVREGTLRYFTELIGKAADIGIDKFVVHPSGEPIAPAERETHLCCAEESLFALAEIAHRAGGIVAVEDLPRTCLGNTSADILRLIGVNEKLRVCFDTNHLLTEDPVAFVQKVGDKIVTVHLSDYDFTDERHWLPGEGKLDWPALCRALDAAGYQGVWVYELPLGSTPHVTRSRELTFDDFYQNAMKLFRYQAP